MRTLRSFLVLVWLVVPCLANSQPAVQSVPDMLNVQGVLRNLSGEAVTGDYVLVFEFYESSGAPTPFLGPLTTPSLHIVGGLFNVNLDLGTEHNYFREHPEVWLRLGVSAGGGPVDWLPRRQITSVGYAFMAENARVCEQLVNPAPDLVCTNPLGCVSPSELTSDFKWALGVSAGGAAADLDCRDAFGNPMSCVSRSEIVDGAINSAKIEDGSIQSADLASGLTLTGDTVVANLVVKGTGTGAGGLYTSPTGLIDATTLRLTPQGELKNITNITLSGQITSTIVGDRSGTGSAPFVIASSKRVDNLNAQYLDGQDSSYYLNASNINSGMINQAYLPKADGTTMGISRAGTGLSATNGVMDNTGVLSVSGVLPIESSGGQNPIITIKTASSSQTGALTSTDWNTFNNKISSVTGVSPIGVTTDPSKNVTVSIQQATATQNGYLSMGDWVTFNNKAEKTGEPGYIQNQSATTQTATFKISGDGTMNVVRANSFVDLGGSSWVLDPSASDISATLNGQVGIGTSGPASAAKVDIVAGAKTYGLQTDKPINITVATGTAPFTVASTTPVTNLNADMLDGYHASSFAPSTGSGNYIQNQFSSAQVANFWIAGNAIITDNAGSGGDLTAKRVCLGGVCNDNWSNAGPWKVVTGSTGSGIVNTNPAGPYQVGIGPGSGSGLTDVKGVLDINNNTWFQTNGSMILQGSRNSSQGIEWYTSKNDRYGIANPASGNLALYTAGAASGSAITFNVANDPNTFNLTEIARIGRSGTGIVPFLQLGDSGGPLTANEAQIAVGNKGTGDPNWSAGTKGVLFRGADVGAFFGIVDNTTPGIVFGEGGAAAKNFTISSYNESGTKTTLLTMLPTGEIGIGKVPSQGGGYIQVPGVANQPSFDAGAGTVVATKFCFPGGGACATDWAEYTKWLSSGNNLYTYANNLNVGIDTSNPMYPLTIGVSNNAANPPGVFAIENNASFVAKDSSGTYKEYLTARTNTNATNLTYGTGGLNVKNEAGTTVINVTNSGNVGVGLGGTAPSYPLHVKGVTRVEGTGTGNGILDIFKGGGTQATRLTSSQSDGSRLWIGTSGGTPTSMDVLIGTQGSYSTSVSLQYTPGTVGAAQGVLDIGQLQRSGSDTWTHGFTKFYTGSATDTSPQLRMMIDNTGDVGIGGGFDTSTNTPAFPLTVITSGRPQLVVGTSQTSGAVAGQISLWGGGTGPTNGVADIGVNAWYDPSASAWKYGGTGYADRIGFSSGNISFYTAPSSSGNITWSKVMDIGQNGNVLIGASAPTSAPTGNKLTVMGTGRFTDFLSLTDGDTSNPKTPTQGYHAATKAYVDSRVGTPVGPGTTDGQTLRYDASQSKWVASSNITNADGNVGIGSPTTVGAKLTINGDVAINDTQVAQPSGWTAGAMKLQVTGFTGGATTGWSGAANFGDNTNGRLVAGVYNQFPAVQGYSSSFGLARDLYINPFGGKVVVGSASADKTFNVGGTARFTGAVTLDNAPTAGTDAANKNYVDSTVDGRVGTGSSNDTLYNNGTKWVTNSTLRTYPGTGISVNPSGATTPTATVDVTGTIKASDNITSAKTIIGTTRNPTGPGTWPNLWEAPAFHVLDVSGGPTNQDNFASITFASTNRPSEPGAIIHNSHPTNRSRFLVSPGGTPDMRDYVGIQNIGGTPGGAPLQIPAYDTEKIRLYADGTAYFYGNVTIGGTPTANTDAATVGWVKANAMVLNVTPNAGDTLRFDGTQWTPNNLLYNNGTKIGIGTTTSSAKLGVNGDVEANGIKTTAGSFFVAEGTAGDWYQGINTNTGKGNRYEWKRGSAPDSTDNFSIAFYKDAGTNPVVGADTLWVKNNIKADGNVSGQQLSATTFCLNGVCKGSWGELTDAYWAGAGKIVYTAGAGKSPPETDWQVGINKTSPAAGYALDVNGKIVSDNVRHYYLVRTVDSAQGSYAELGEFSVMHGAVSLDVWLTQSESGQSISKHYIVPLAYGIGTGAGDWINVVPISSTGAFGGDFELQLYNVTGAEAVHRLRIQRTAAASAQSKIVAHIAERGLNGTGGLSFNTTFNELTGTGTAPVPSAMLESTVLTQVDGKVGVGTRTPSYLFDVNGNQRITSNLYLGDSNTALSKGTSNSMKVTTNNGWVEIGAQNASWTHFIAQSGRPFYFNQQVSVNGNLLPYSDNTYDLGSSSNRWRDAYVANKIYLAGTDLSTLLYSGTGNQNQLVKFAATGQKTLAGAAITEDGSEVYSSLKFRSDSAGKFGTGSVNGPTWGGTYNANLFLVASSEPGIEFQHYGNSNARLYYSNGTFYMQRSNGNANLNLTGNLSAVNVTGSGTVQGATVTATGQLNGNTINVTNGGTIAGTTYMGTIGSSSSRVTKLWATDIDVSGTIQGGNVNAGTGTFSGTVSAPNITLNGVNRNSWPVGTNATSPTAQYHVKFTSNSTDPVQITSSNLYDSGTDTYMTGTFRPGGLATSGTVSAGTVSATTGNFSGTLTGGTVNSNGNITAVGTIQGATITSTGAVNGNTINITNGGTIGGSTNIGGVTLANNGGSFSGTLSGGTFSGTFTGTFNGDGVGLVCTQSSQGPSTKGIGFTSQDGYDGSIDESSNAWADVGNMSKTFTLARRALVWMQASGGQTGTGHVGLRFVIDGTPTGHSNWGNKINYVNVDWGEFIVSYGVILGAGTHTIKLQARSNSGSNGVCLHKSDSGEYGGCKLLIQAVYCDTAKCPDYSYY